jgi:hypothetical protein
MVRGLASTAVVLGCALLGCGCPVSLVCACCAAATRGLRSARGDVVMVAWPFDHIGYSLGSSAAARRRLGRNRAQR